MSKAAEAFRTISEVAGDLDIPKHVLRFWEAKFPQIRPMKRGGGRRYYRPEDLELLRGIRRLLHAEGYTIKGVQKILREMGIDHVKAYGASPEPQAGAARAGTNAAVLKRRNSTSTASMANGRTATSADAGADFETTIQSAIRELQACRAILLGEPPAASAVASPRTARTRAARS